MKTNSRLSPLLRLGRLSESRPLGFNWREASQVESVEPVSSKRSDVLKKLKDVLGEYADWQGYSVPINVGRTPATGFGFHTKGAEEIWKYAQRLADAHPKETTASIIGKAIDQSNIPITELTPEDSKMLDMAVNWYLAGKVGGMEQPGPPPYGGNSTSGTQKNFPDSGSL